MFTSGAAQRCLAGERGPYLGEGIEPKQLHTQVGLAYHHEHVYDYPTD
ncbi:hypothetical protein [Rhodococcus opacus]|nr:hypothetical protein [Rhodococcus opacus]